MQAREIKTRNIFLEKRYYRGEAKDV